MIYSQVLSNALVAAPIFFGMTEAVPRVGAVQARGHPAVVAVPAGSCGGDGGDKKITVDIVLTPGVAGQVVAPGSGDQGGLKINPGGIISSGNGGSSTGSNGGGNFNNNYGGSLSNANSGSINADGGSVSGSGNSNNANSNNNNNSNGGININNVNNNSNNIQLPTGWIAKPTVTTYTYTVTNGLNHTSTGTTTQTITVTVPVTSQTPTGSSLSSGISSSSASSVSPTASTTSRSAPTPSSCALSKCAAGQIGASALTIVNALNSTDALFRDLLSLTDPLKGSPQGQIDAQKVGSAFADIVSAVIDDIGVLKDVKPFDLGCDSTAVYYALEAVLGSVEAVADLLIGKGGIVDSVPLLGPVIAFGIRAIEKPIAALAEDVLSLIPHLKLCTGAAPFGSYQGSIGKAIGVKNPGFCYKPSDCALGQISESAQSIVNTLDSIDKVLSDFVNINIFKLLGDVVVSASVPSCRIPLSSSFRLVLFC